MTAAGLGPNLRPTPDEKGVSRGAGSHGPRGPYRLWHHEHRFSDQNGGTLVADEVQYRVPGGRLINRLFVAPDLRRTFAYRTQKLQEIFGVSR